MRIEAHQLVTAFALCLGAVGSSVMGCELIASVDRTIIPDEPTGAGGAGTASTTTGGGMGGSGGTGGTGGEGACGSPVDCPQPPNECVEATCTNKMCGQANAEDQKPTKTQTQGDCKTNVCDGNGGIISIDGEDAPDDMKECTKDTCMNGKAVHENVAPGTACTQDGGKKCNDKGVCVQCVEAADCKDPAAPVCDVPLGKCVPQQCANGQKDGKETDLDCGGGDCVPCGDNLACEVSSDCKSKVCTNKVCQVASCSDTTENQDETDIDCGGAACPKCDNGKKCLAPTDCKSSDCVNGTCDESCTDGMKTGAESDVDCGGGPISMCSACAVGKACTLATDCASGACNPPVGGGKCDPAAHCSNSMTDPANGETDQDCGGPSCAGCATGKMCKVAGDCTSNVCTAGLCE